MRNQKIDFDLQKDVFGADNKIEVCFSLGWSQKRNINEFTFEGLKLPALPYPNSQRGDWR